MTSRSVTRRVGLLCGNGTARATYLDFAQELGASLGAAGAGLVYGGTPVGLMSTVVQAAADGGCVLTNVVPAGATPIGEALVVADAGRQRRLVRQLAHGFVVLPGGLDTLDEFSELVVSPQARSKPIVLVNLCRYFDPLLALLDHGVAESFVTSAERHLVEVADSVDEVLALLGLTGDLMSGAA